ncbi:hypothetical protein PSD17_04220 [Pseudonocardia sp. D17]|nr:hypothetical protein PSD17_04220 [Pseudonocardia sp. D17]
MLPAPVAGAPLTSGSLAWLALAATARELSDFARGLVASPSPGDSGYDGALLVDALRVRELAEQVLNAAILTERLTGTGWSELADELGAGAAEVQQRWQPAVAAWDHQVEHAAAFGSTSNTPRAVAEPVAVADELDQWVSTHHETGDPPVGQQPVTSGLAQMDPLRELLHLAALRRLYGAKGQCTADLAAREATVEHALGHAHP